MPVFRVPSSSSVRTVPWVERRLPLRLPGGGAFLRELLLAGGGALAYYLIRGGVADRVDQAFQYARSLMDLERSLGLFQELPLQEWALSSSALVEVMNALYFWLHMPLIIGMALWLFARHRPVYRRTRNAFVLSAIVALAVYYLVPVAPPRLFPELGFVDTMALYSEASYQAQEVGVFVNPYAALPSLHVGWSLLLGLALWRARPGQPGFATVTFGVGAVALPLGQTVAVVLTANHFLLDVVAGIGLALAADVAVMHWQRARQRGQELPQPAIASAPSASSSGDSQ